MGHNTRTTINLIFLFFFLIPYIRIGEANTPADKIRNGIFFRYINTWNLNENTLHFQKTCKTKHITDMVRLLNTIKNTHKKICDIDFTPNSKSPLVLHSKKIMNSYAGKFVLLHEQAPASQVENICKKIKMQLPEIRTEKMKMELLSFMTNEKLKEARAGIVIKPEFGEIYYKTDGMIVNYSSPFPRVTTKFGAYEGKQAWEHFNNINSYHEHIKYFYYYIDSGTIQLAATREGEIKDKKWNFTLPGIEKIFPVICQYEFKDKEANDKNDHYWELDFANKCKTTQKDMAYTITLISDKARAIDPIIMDKNKIIPKSQEIYDINRSKRGIPAVILSMATQAILTQVASSIIEKIPQTDNKMSAQLMKLIQDNKEVLSDVLQIQSKIQKQIIEMKQSLKNIIINAATSLNYAMAIHNELTLSVSFSTFSLQLNKAIDDILMLITAKKAPFYKIISQKELENITSTFESKYDVTLRKQIKMINYEVVKNGSNFHLIFSIATKNKDHKASIYQIEPLPIFINGKNYMPQIAFRYVGIIHKNNKFTQLSLREIQTCQQDDVCNTNKPIFTQKYDICGATNFFRESRTCTYMQLDDTTPFLKTVGNTSYIATVKSLKFKVICNRNLLLPPEVEHITVKGVAKLQIPTGCELQNENMILWPTSVNTKFFNYEVQTPKVVFEKLHSDLKTSLTVIKTKHKAYVQQKHPKIVYDMSLKKFQTMLIIIVIIGAMAMLHIMYTAIIPLMKWYKRKKLVQGQNEEEQFKVPTKCYSFGSF